MHHEKTYLGLNKFSILPRGRSAVFYTAIGRLAGRKSTLYSRSDFHILAKLSVSISENRYSPIALFSIFLITLSPRPEMPRSRTSPLFQSQKFRMTFYKNRYLFTSPSGSHGLTLLFHKEPLGNAPN